MSFEVLLLVLNRVNFQSNTWATSEQIDSRLPPAEMY